MINTVKPSRNSGIAQPLLVCAPFLFLLLVLWPCAALASPQTAPICDIAAQTASSESGVPLAVMRSITRTETGRTRDGALQPWPWTVNMEGLGKWFDTEDAARAYVFKHFKRGARSFDVGCFQINYKWHGQAFHSIDEMFDPLANARYAARFLTQLFEETGDWSAAAGVYHSRTPEYATRYRARFDRIHKTMQGAPLLRTASTNTRLPRVNTYPLLQSGEQAGHGSLVPLGQGGGQALYGVAQPLYGS